MAEVKERIAGLIVKYLKKDLSSGEERELSDWLSSSGANQQLFDNLTDEESFHQEVQELYHFKNEAWNKISDEISGARLVPMKRPWIRWVAAASIILVLGISYFLFVNKAGEVTGTKKEIAKVNDVPAPKESRAVITLADGSKVYLDSASNGILATQGDVKLAKHSDGAISYQIPTNSQQLTANSSFNTLTNPRGSKVIDMQLSDGSHVWLNAGSSVTYPVAFVGKERKVEITGEAYFEVAHNASKPFIVSKGDVNVTVLGTHFNVNAYDDEEALKVTLLEGSVRVTANNPSTPNSYKLKANSLTLNPGQQAILTNSYKLSANSSPDLEEVMAWKDGMFHFNDASIEEVMRQVARWYDVEVMYQGSITEPFKGKVPRTVKASELFEMLESTGWVHFKIEGKKVIVSP